MLGNLNRLQAEQRIIEGRLKDAEIDSIRQHFNDAYDDPKFTAKVLLEVMRSRDNARADRQSGTNRQSR